MNYNKLHTVLWAAIAVAALVWAPTALANTGKFRVEIPFAFQAGGNTFDAGMYSVGYDAGTNLVSIIPDAGGTGAYLLGHASYGNYGLDRGSLLFHKVGDQWALRRVRSASRQFGAELALPKADKEMAKRESVSPEAAVLYAMN